MLDFHTEHGTCGDYLDICLWFKLTVLVVLSFNLFNIIISYDVLCTKYVMKMLLEKNHAFTMVLTKHANISSINNTTSSTA